MSTCIVADSSSDTYSVPEINYASVPLKVLISGQEFVDTPDASPAEMMAALKASTSKSSSSCPNVQEWLDAFEGHDEVFGVTISSNLSGSYESARVARRMYEQTHPTARVHIVDSLATGPVERLLIEHMRDDILAGKQFNEIKDSVHQYQKRVRILYPLRSLENLARNGRVSMTVAKIAGALDIRIIGDASPEGTIQLLHKCRGEKKALKLTYKEMLSQGYLGGKVRIHHCQNEEAAEKLADTVRAAFADADVQIVPCGILDSFYADDGGLIIGYEV